MFTRAFTCWVKGIKPGYLIIIKGLIMFFVFNDANKGNEKKDVKKITLSPHT